MVTHPIPAPNDPISSHDVYFYETDCALGRELERHIGSALEHGDSVIMIATETHCKDLRQALKKRGINLIAAIKAANYIERDAAKMLGKFMVDGMPDKNKFRNTIGDLISRAKRNGKQIVLFGEMVALLWADGKRDAAVRLEGLWNELGEQHTFHLLCAYPSSAFESPEHKRLFFNICGEHSEVNKHQSQSHDTTDAPLGPFKRSSSILANEIHLSQQRILTMRKVAKAGAWELDIANDLLLLSTAGAKLLGFQSASRVRLDEFFNLMYYSGDREVVFQRLQQAQRHRKEFTAHFRIGNSTGNETRLIQMRGTTFYNVGSPIMLGMLNDITPFERPIDVKR